MATAISIVGIFVVFLPLIIYWCRHRRKFKITCDYEEHLEKYPDVVVELENQNWERTLTLVEARIEYIDLINNIEIMKVVQIPEKKFKPGEKRKLYIDFSEMVEEGLDLKFWNFCCIDDMFRPYKKNLYPYIIKVRIMMERV